MNNHLYNWVARFENTFGEFNEVGGLMIASSAVEVLSQIRHDYADAGDIISERFECKIKRSDMNVAPIDGKGIMYDVLYRYKLSNEELDWGICDNDIFQENVIDVVYISNHPTKERVRK